MIKITDLTYKKNREVILKKVKDDNKNIKERLKKGKR